VTVMKVGRESCAQWTSTSVHWVQIIAVIMQCAQT